MMQVFDKLATWLIHSCVKLLEKIGYTVPKVYRNKRGSAIFAVAVPLTIALISIFLIGEATVPMLIVHLCGVAYHYFISWLEHEKFKKEYEKRKTTAQGVGSSIYSHRCTAVAVIAVVTIVIPVLSLFFPERVPSGTAIWLCAFADIALSCVLNIINALVLWSGAEVVIPI